MRAVFVEVKVDVKLRRVRRSQPSCTREGMTGRRRTYEHASIGADPVGETVEVLVSDTLKHVALLEVKVGDSASVGEEAIVTPLVEEDEDDSLGGGAGVDVRGCTRSASCRDRAPRLSNSPGLEVGVGSDEVDDVHELLGTSEESDTHSRTEDLGHGVEANDSASLSSVASLQLNVAGSLLLGVEVEEGVGIVLEDEEVVLASEGENLLLARQGRGAAGRVGSGGASEGYWSVVRDSEAAKATHMV